MFINSLDCFALSRYLAHMVGDTLLRSIALVLTVVCFSTNAWAQSHIEQDLIGQVTQYRIKEKDNLYAIARQHGIGIVEILSANPGTDPWKPEPGTILTLPSIHVLPPEPRDGIVINLSELRLFYFPGDGTAYTFPIGIGKDGWETPTGETTIIRKRKNPTWTPPDSIRAENPDLPEIIEAGPNNPLGAYAMNLDWPGYVIHGTNRPNGIGKRSSHGCIRLYPEDIEQLFMLVEVGTPVTIIDTPYKLGWKGDTLYLEVTPTQTQGDTIAKYQKPSPQSTTEIYSKLEDAIANLQQRDITIDWYAVETAIRERSGIPVVIGTQ